jgi:hypothetical protein
MLDIRRPKYDGWRILFRMRLVKARENEISARDSAVLARDVELPHT